MVNIKKEKYTLNPFRVVISSYLGEDGCFAGRDNKFSQVLARLGLKPVTTDLAQLRSRGSEQQP
jgi:hypothetical protein